MTCPRCVSPYRARLPYPLNPTGYGTLLAEGKETRLIDGRHYVLESPILVDYALINAETGDRWGNLLYRKTARNFSPVMAMAARPTIASVGRVCALGDIDPEQVVTPGIFVKHIVLPAACPDVGWRWRIATQGRTPDRQHGQDLLTSPRID